jgi:2-polyprenyl-3-methyl-5-hydroxy-6-metoxy-1,4-benzoquinol methylase
MELAEARRTASLLSEGISTGEIRSLVLRCLRDSGARGDLLDFGAGKGDLLAELSRLGNFQSLAGADLYPRPSECDARIEWHQRDLNDPLQVDRAFDVVVCSETIEHLENPRQTFRTLHQSLKSGGTLVLTMPNQESVRSFAGLLFAGHFTHFLGASYPAHITALLRLDLRRLCSEVGFDEPTFAYSNAGLIPRLTWLSWQRVSLGMLRGRLFSDNLAMITRKSTSVAPTPAR